MNIFIPIQFIFLVTAVAINSILALVVFINDRRSVTNIIFVILSLITSAWLVIMRLSVDPQFISNSLLWIRLSVFLAVPQSIAFFLLAHTFPHEKLVLKVRTFMGLLFIGLAVMALTLSSYVFRDVEILNNSPHPIVGPGVIPFGLFVTFFSLAAIYIFFRKLKEAPDDERRRLWYVMLGILLMLGLIIATILIPVAVFGINNFVILAPVYVLVFLGATAYAIVRYRLFNVKVIVTEALIVTIWVFLLSKAFSPGSLQERALDVLIFVAVLSFGILLIKSVRREVEQREKLQKLSEELEDLSHFKTQLLSLASHQMKAPLAAIKGFASILIDGLYGRVSGKVKDTLVKIKQSSDDLVALIDNLLDLRRVEEGKMEYNFEKIKINDLVRGVFGGLAPLAKAKKLEFTFEPCKECEINADSQKLKQVVQNIIDNAIKYTPKGFVKVEINLTGEEVVVSVKDSGYGISKDLAPHLFEEYIRDEKIKQLVRGTGLGLFIAKKMIEAQNGGIWFESDGDGKGSTFYISLKRV